MTASGVGTDAFSEWPPVWLKFNRSSETRSRTNADSGAPRAPDAWRETGIRGFGHMPWGSHLCVFYETKDDLLDIAASYFEAGLKSNELCLWAVSILLTEIDISHALRLAIPALDRRLKEGRIEALKGTEWYLKRGEFDVERVISAWRKRLDGALARGLEG